MSKSADVHLNPGDFRFAGGGTRLHTVLGSCVAITLWHPGKGIGGMCHYLLPGRHPATEGTELDGRYAGDAVQLFLRELRRHGTEPREYTVKVFGGADQFPHLDGPLTGVAGQNSRIGLDLLEQHGFSVSIREVGGHGSRRIIFDLRTGYVWLRSLAPLAGRSPV